MCVLSLQIAGQKLYEHWKRNAPELREVTKIMLSYISHFKLTVSLIHIIGFFKMTELEGQTGTQYLARRHVIWTKLVTSMQHAQEPKFFQISETLLSQCKFLISCHHFDLCD